MDIILGHTAPEPYSVLTPLCTYYWELSIVYRKCCVQCLPSPLYEFSTPAVSTAKAMVVLRRHHLSPRSLEAGSPRASLANSEPNRWSCSWGLMENPPRLLPPPALGLPAFLGSWLQGLSRAGTQATPPHTAMSLLFLPPPSSTCRLLQAWCCCCSDHYRLTVLQHRASSHSPRARVCAGCALGYNGGCAPRSPWKRTHSFIFSASRGHLHCITHGALRFHNLQSSPFKALALSLTVLASPLTTSLLPLFKIFIGESIPQVSFFPH